MANIAGLAKVIWQMAHNKQLCLHSSAFYTETIKTESLSAAAAQTVTVCLWKWHWIIITKALKPINNDRSGSTACPRNEKKRSHSIPSAEKNPPHKTAGVRSAHVTRRTGTQWLLLLNPAVSYFLYIVFWIILNKPFIIKSICKSDTIF